jgi:hypothetical protein
MDQTEFNESNNESNDEYIEISLGSETNEINDEIDRQCNICCQTPNDKAKKMKFYKIC